MFMRILRSLSLTPLFLAQPVFAQVTVDLNALHALPERPAVAAPPRQTVTVPSRTVMRALPAQPAAPVADTNSTPEAPAANLPDSAPAPAPIASAETATAPPIGSAKPPSVSASLRVGFTAGDAQLGPDATGAIQQLVQGTQMTDATSFSVMAYAPGVTDDPSSARRLSLARAMAVRSALVGAGVPSARIFVRALGTQFGSGPADRADIEMTSGAEAAAAR